MGRRRSFAHGVPTLGSPDTYALADAANRNVPVLRTLRSSRRARRRDPVSSGVARADAARGGSRRALRAVAHAAARRARCARRRLLPARASRERHAMPVDDDVCLRARARAARAARLAPTWMSRILANDYDPRALPVAQKRAALIGMGMTERQGGSDVRANVTRAEPDGGGAWRITRSQMVLLRAAMRRASRAGANRRRSRLLPDAARESGRRAQRDPHQPAEGQARQPVQRIRRSRVRSRARVAGRPHGSRHRDDPRDGPVHAARLRDRQRGDHPGGARVGAASRAASDRRSAAAWPSIR